jgi:hypothetical protein
LIKEGTASAIRTCLFFGAICPSPIAVKVKVHGSYEEECRYFDLHVEEYVDRKDLKRGGPVFISDGIRLMDETTHKSPSLKGTSYAVISSTVSSSHRSMRSASYQVCLTVAISQVEECLPLNSLLSAEDDIEAYRGNLLVVKCDSEGRVLDLEIDGESAVCELLSSDK